MKGHVSRYAIEEGKSEVVSERTSTLWPGTAYPLGATYDGSGTNFSIFAENAERVVLCLFDDGGKEERLELKEVDGYCWHGYVAGVRPGQRYGYRVHGPWEPAKGLRSNPQKLLLDPYAKAIQGAPSWDPSCFDYVFGKEDERSDADSAPHVPRSIVHDPLFDWSDDRAPRTPLHQTIIYELHVKGFTMMHPGIPEHLRGTFAGLAEDPAIDYLTRLGITAVELMPVHQFIHDGHLVERGLRNYWGYNSIGFFAPHSEYASQGQRGEQVPEFKAMVKRLHAAGIEVILDVVYNHTAEGNHLGPTLCFKGIDNPSYYRLVADDKRYYFDTTGTGNSLNMSHPHVSQLLMDSLRYWVLEMHVDGFRFDLAAALARELHEVNRLSSFFEIIQQDPVISQVKLIAEPWDLGEGGYQVGNFPPLWSEWNGKYRDAVRDFWRGADETLGEFANRITGSSDLYQADTRRPMASINFITAHDGFTLHDLVSFNDKHNEANGEENRDGENYNRSWNCGVEGETDDEAIRALRAKQRRNFLATLFLSQGVPMLLAGDEICRTQRGNNNAYCQDNEMTWFDWDHLDNGAGLLEVTRRLIALRRKHPLLRRPHWFQGQAIRGTEDISWLRPDGGQMRDADWDSGAIRSVAVFLNGDGLPAPDARGRWVYDQSLLILFNGDKKTVKWKLPKELGKRWELVVDTATQFDEDDPPHFDPGETVPVADRSTVVLVDS